ncbi:MULTISPECIES: DUF927 domain-containing protein [unclassified Providencia]|uniref:DUF927 domain-containing protein n=1 Tax=unclassified Providencia TaxID=2633465 RepID=UPI00234BE92F|nr:MULTISPECIES: DUF927 domain-containing protein [unclassified Providencia]WOC01118.1 DUF927 domain-containing protein [Providencia sp. PROV046]
MDNFIFQDTAIFLATNNIPIHPLIAGTKRPVDKGWSNAPSLTFDNIEKQIPLWITKGYGLGARTGYPLSNGALFYVIDVDIHGEALTTEITHELHTQLYNLGLDPNLPNVITGRGNGSCHYYVSVPNSKLTTIIGAAKTICKSKYVHEGKPYWIIEVLGKGKQVVVPPTIHPETNKPYLLKSLKITEASKELLDTLTDIMTTKTQLFQSNNSNYLPNEIRQKCAQLFDKAIASFDIEADITKLKSALEAINADCSYDIWRNVIWAICAHNIMDGISIAKNWSKTSNKYEEYTFNAVWDSYNPSGGINAGTLYYIANEQGWNNSEIKSLQQSIPTVNDCPCFRVFNETVTHITGSYHSGVWFFNANDANVKGELVCTPVTIDAITCDASESNFGLLLEIKNPLGKLRKWAMPMELLSGSGEPARAVLLSLGVRIYNYKLLNAYLTKSIPTKKILCTSQLGWFDNLFVLPDCTYGSFGQHEVVFQTASEPISIYSPKGTLADWKNEISSFAIGNPLLTTAICCAFSGALIEPCHAESGGLHFYGDSSTGKTTLIQVACSVWGGSNYMRSWRATANGIEGAASMFNSTLLALDEISECKSTEVGQIIYALGNGQGKQRASKTGAAKSIARWKTAVISSGELTTSATVELAGENAKAGQSVRLIDISAQRSYGAWDSLNGFISGSALSEHLKAQSTMNYGIAGREFLVRLVNDKQTLSSKLEQILCKPEFNSERATGQAKRVAKRFALLALSGELATSYGITGWESGYATKVISEMFKQWQAITGDAPLEKQQIIQQVRSYIERYGDSRFSYKDSSPLDRFIHERSGWWTNSSSGDRIFLFNSAGLRDATKGYDFKRVLKALTEEGILILREKNQSGGDRVRINGQQSRVYPISFPESDSMEK